MLYIGPSFSPALLLRQRPGLIRVIDFRHILKFSLHGSGTICYFVIEYDAEYFI